MSDYNYGPLEHELAGGTFADDSAEHEQPVREDEEWRSVNMTDTAFDHRPVVTIEQGDKLLATAYSLEVAETIIRDHRLAALVPGLQTALEQIAELEGDDENQKFKLTRFQVAQVARRAFHAVNAIAKEL